MLPLPDPDPQVYLLASSKVLLGQRDTDAILAAVTELHPNLGEGTPFEESLFEWKWLHVHQYRDAFGNSCSYLTSTPDHPNIRAKKLSKTPPLVKAARAELAAHSLKLMSSLCQGTTNV